MKKLGFPVPLSDWLMEDKYYNKCKGRLYKRHCGEVLRHI